MFLIVLLESSRGSWEKKCISRISTKLNNSSYTYFVKHSYESRNNNSPCNHFLVTLFLKKCKKNINHDY